MMTTLNNILPVCLPNPDQAKFSIPSPHTSADNNIYSYRFIKVVIYGTVLFPSYSVTTKLHSVAEPSDGCCVKNPGIGSVKDIGEKVRQY